MVNIIAVKVQAWIALAVGLFLGFFTILNALESDGVARLLLSVYAFLYLIGGVGFWTIFGCLAEILEKMRKTDPAQPRNLLKDS